MGRGLDERTPLLAEQRSPSVPEGPQAGSRRGWCGPDGCLTRLTALILMSFIGFGAFFCFDNPGALQSEIKSGLNLTTSQFSSLYSCYSWPNLVLPVIGGFLIDSVFGLRLGTIIFSVFILLGQIMLGVGTLRSSLLVMQAARFCYGVGGESLNMALNTYTVAWFKDRELNMVFGFQLSLGRVGSTVNFLVMEPLFSLLREHLDSVSALGWAFILAASLTLISLLASIGLAALDRRRERSGLRLVEAGGEGQNIRLADIQQFPAVFWLLCLTTLAYYGSVFPFISLAQGLFQTEYNYTAQDANFIVGLVYLTSAIASPLFGLVLDRFGRNLAWMCGSLAISGLAHGVLAFTSINPYFPIIILGLAYSVLASALWSLPAVIVPQSQLATAFGIMQALQNLGTAVITVGAGNIVDLEGYLGLETFFIGWITVATVSALAIWLLDYSHGGDLNRSAEQNTTEISYEGLSPML